MGQNSRGQLIWLFLVLVACTVLPLLARDDEDQAVPEEAYRVYSSVLDGTPCPSVRVSIASETANPSLVTAVIRRLYVSPTLVRDFEERNAQAHALESRFRMRAPYDLVPASAEPQFTLSAVGFSPSMTDAMVTVNQLALTLHRDPGGTWAVQKTVPLTDLTKPASAP